MDLQKNVDCATTDYATLQNRETWNKFSFENDLDDYDAIKNTLGSWKKFKQLVFIAIGKNNISFFYTPKFWDKYAKQNNLPASKQFSTLFDKWKSAQSIIHDGKTPLEIKKEFLIKVATENKQHFDSQKKWNDFAVMHDLPIAATYKNHFGSWVNIVLQVTGKMPSERRYTKEELLNVMIKYKEHLTTEETWQKFSRENNLPSFHALGHRFGSFNDAKRRAMVSSEKIQKRVFTKEELLKVALEYKDVFFHSIWTFIATTYRLPTEMAYINCFGSFKNAQKAIGVVEGEWSEYTKETILRTIKKKNRKLKDSISKHEAVLEQITAHWEYFTSKAHWNQHAEKNNLPDYHELLVYFDTFRNLRQAIFYYIAVKHREKFNFYEWEAHAAQNNLPNKERFSRMFSRWEYIQCMIWGGSKEGTKVFLIKVAKEHKSEMTTSANWKIYARANQLPSAMTFENYFGSWTKAKAAAGLILKTVKNKTAK